MQRKASSHFRSHALAYYTQWIRRTVKPITPSELRHAVGGAQSAASTATIRSETRERYLSLHSIGVYVDDGSGASIDDDIFIDQGADADMPLIRGGLQVTRAVQLALCTTRDLAPALRGVPLVQPAAAALVAGVAGA